MGLFDLIGRNQSERTKLQAFFDILMTVLFSTMILFWLYKCDKKHKEFINSPEQVELRKQNELNQLRKRIIELESTKN